MEFITRKMKAEAQRHQGLSSGIFKALFLGLSMYMGVSAAAVEISDPSTLLSASAQGRGGATAASSQYQDSLFQNPASAVFTKRYAVSASYLGWGDSLAAAIVDTQSGPVGGGVYYVRRDLKQDALISQSLGNYERMEEHMGFSLMGKLSENLGVGTNVRYVYRKSSDFGNASAWNFDVGVKFQPSSIISIGAIAQNMMEDRIGVYPRRFTGALELSPLPTLHFSAQMFQISAANIKNSDFTLPNSVLKNGYAAGAEFLTPISLALRAGYSESPSWNQKLASFGLGYSQTEFSLDYAYQQDLKNSVLSVHTVTLTGFF